MSRSSARSAPPTLSTFHSVLALCLFAKRGPSEPTLHRFLQGRFGNRHCIAVHLGPLGGSLTRASSLLWCCGVVVLLCCGAVVLWYCCDAVCVVVLLWYCCGAVVVLLWCCCGAVVLYRVARLLRRSSPLYSVDSLLLVLWHADDTRSQIFDQCIASANSAAGLAQRSSEC